MPEDPSRDEDISSLFASGIGEITNQALVAAGVGMTLGPEAIPFAIGSLYSARYMKEGYDLNSPVAGIQKWLCKQE